MEYLTLPLNDAVSKLSGDQQEEIDVIESIVNTNEVNRENTKEKVFRYLEKRKIDKCINFILGCINHAAQIRPKERKSLLFLLTSVFDNFNLNYEIAKNYETLMNMLGAGNVVPCDYLTGMNILDFADDGTIERAIFEDDFDSLQQLLAYSIDDGRGQSIDISNFFNTNVFKIYEANRLELAALFGSVKCFKYLMMNGYEINKETCKFAVAGGNNEIIHLCEQKGLVFDDCLFISSMYHRFEIFEWLNTHFNYEDISFSEFIEYYNEPLFYFYSLSGSNVETEDKNGRTPLSHASSNGLFEVVKYLYQQCHADVETKDNYGYTPISWASFFGHHEIVKYLYETCHANVETKDNNGYTPISWASLYGHLEVVKYLNETCHASVEIKDKYGRTPINNASRNDNLEIVKYLYESCHANVETKDNYGRTPMSWATYYGYLDVVKYLNEACHTDVKTKNNECCTLINNVALNGRFDAIKCF